MNPLLPLATRVTREQVLTEFATESCVASVRVLLDTLEYFGVNAKALPVEVMVFNDEALRVGEEGGFEAVRLAVHATDAHAEGGPWSIGLGMNPDISKREAGHVVVAVPEEGVILDPSLDQASRPKKNIVLSPSVIPISDPDWFTTPGATETFTVEAGGEHPVGLVYTHSRFSAYLHSPNWKRRTRVDDDGVFKRVTGASIRQIRDEG